MEAYTITAGNQTWTRDNVVSAKKLAHNIVKKLRLAAVVTYTSTGEVLIKIEP